MQQKAYFLFNPLHPLPPPNKTYTETQNSFALHEGGAVGEEAFGTSIYK